MDKVHLPKRRSKMEKETFTIRLLEDKEFDKLPYEGISDSLGFADPETGCAFVRKTGVKDWDMATIQHEIDELLSKESFDTDSKGIRHKKFFKDVGIPVLSTLAGSLIGAPYLGALGAPLGAAAGSAIQQKIQTGRIDPLQTGLAAVGGALGGPGIKAGFAGAKAAGKGILGTVGAGIKGAFTGGPKITPATTAPATTTPAQSLFGRIMGSLKTGKDISAIPSTVGQPILGTALGALQGPITQAQAARGVTTLGQAPGAGGVSAVGAPITAGVTASTSPPTAGGFGEIAKRLTTPEGLLGAGTLLAGAMPKAPEFEMPASVGELEQAFLTQGGVSEVGRAARGELMKTLQARPEELFPVADDAFIQASLRGTRESYERAQEQLDATYNKAGVYGSGEHLAAKDELREELAQLESDFIALENQRRFTMAQTAKQNAVTQALRDAGITDQQIMNIVALDVQRAAIEFGTSVEDMSVIKEALAGIGTEVLTGAFKPAEETVIE